MARIYAAADIGSNTAHLLVAASDGDLVMRIDNLNEWISLGEVVARKGIIPLEQQEQLVAAIKEFKRVATVRAASSLYVFATEAVRSASNHKEVLKKIKAETGVTVEVILPRREAEFSFHGAMLDTKQSKPTLMVELGGGSVQVANVKNGQLDKEISLPLGTGRIIAETGLGSPATEEAMKSARNYIERMLKNCDISVKEARMVASGGVARGLWRALHPDNDKALALEEIEYLAWSTARTPTDRIVQRFGVKTKRAGTLLPGALVYMALMKRFNVNELLISEFGVREGAILQMARGKI